MESLWKVYGESMALQLIHRVTIDFPYIYYTVTQNQLDMAQITKNKLITGILGKVVFREVGNKQILLSKAGKVKQTKSTQLSGSEFRQCSSWSKRLRSGLKSFTAGQTDSTMHGRLTGKLYQAIQTNTEQPKGNRTPMNSDMDLLGGFEFNTHSPFTDYCALTLTAIQNEQKQIIVTVPELHPKADMKFMPNTTGAELLLYVVAMTLEGPAHFVEGYTLLPIDKNTAVVPETVWSGPVIPEGYFVVVCAKLLYYAPNKFTEKEYVNHKGCNPAQLIMAK